MSKSAGAVTLSSGPNAPAEAGIARPIPRSGRTAPGIRSMRPGPPTNPKRPLARSGFRFASGLAYLALVAVIFSDFVGIGFLPMFVAVLVGAAFCTVLAIVWLTCWALREDSRAGQFGLGSLFFLTTFAAVYFGLVRWLVVHSRHFVGRGPNEAWQQYLGVGLLCVVLCGLAVPFLLIMAEGLVWLAVRIVRHPRVRRWLKGRRSDRE